MKRLAIAVILLCSTFSATAQAGALTLLPQPPAAPAACSAGYISLSYDDGPTALTPKLLTALKNNGLKATFFVVGDHISEFPQAVKNEYAAGHQIANHSQSHGNLTEATSVIHDLVTTQYSLIQQTGQIPAFYRPPYGATTPEIRGKAKELDLTEVIWTVDTLDWDTANTTTPEIVATVKTAIAGDFVLGHDGYQSSIDAIPQIAKDLKARGLCTGKIVTAPAGYTNAWQGLDFDAAVAKF